MRLSVDDIGGDDKVKAELLMHAEVYLDGEPVDMCVLADEEEGYIDRYILKEDARWQGEFAGIDYWPTERVHGIVKIKDRRDNHEI